MLFENNAPVDYDVICSEAFNAVAIVLETSPLTLGANYHNPLQIIKRGIQSFINSTNKDDRILIGTYHSDGSIGLPFTDDLDEARNFVNLLDYSDPFGELALYFTIDLAFNELINQSGRRICVVIGTAQNSDDIHTVTLKDLNTKAVENNITVFYLRLVYKDVQLVPMQELCSATNGYSMIMVDEEIETIPEALLEISKEVTSPGCTFIYRTENCTDPSRSVRLSAQLSNQHYTADTVVTFPSRPDTVTIAAFAEYHELTPSKRSNVFLHLAPQLSTKMRLSFSFLIKYDPDALRLVDPVYTDGTIVSDGDLVIDEMRPGVLKCTFGPSRPAVTNGDMFGLRFAANMSDSSRPAFIVIDSVSMTNGCPNTVITYPDTIYICNCELEVNATAVPDFVTTTEEMRVPFELSQTLYPERALFTSLIHFDPDYLTPIGVDGIGAMTEDARLEWRLRAPDTLEVRADEGFMPKDGRTLFYARFRVKQPKAAVESHLSVPYVRAFSDCCYGLEKTSTTSILIDGECEKIVRRVGEFTLAQNAPNPVRGETSFRFTVHSKGALDGTLALLTLYRSDGKAIAELYNQSITDGEYTVPYSTADLPAGMYYVVLNIGENSQTRSVVVE